MFLATNTPKATQGQLKGLVEMEEQAGYEFSRALLVLLWPVLRSGLLPVNPLLRGEG